ncbi:NAD(P)-dependent oxidoreductase [Variovorax terrae]|uniref:Hydroxyacid dehydrogenase n=1 Tax=Variovorax terrae TaxID=2923278 RepID=A0A9X1W1H4_9BURK|nr:hydroxyacid dehydrogenase [Variovorax terrae]
MDILLLEALVPEAMAWLESRHSVEYRPELADDASALRKAVYKAEAVVLPRKVVLTREFLDFAPRLRAVARLHGGTDNTDLEACRERSVKVVQALTANVRSNAEYLLAGLLLLFRRGIGSSLIGNRHADIRLGRELNGSTIGILGLAPTAHTLALMLHSLGAKLVGYDPAVHHTAPIWERLRIQPVSLPELMAQADGVSVQVMYASRYRGFVNDKVLAHCKRGQVWVGTSRSSLFDPQALAGALGDGRIDACMIDGAEAGFASRGSPLHEVGNLFVTPRLGSHTRESRLRASWYVAHRLHDALSAPPNLDSVISAPMGLAEPPAAREEPQFIIR